MRLIFIDLHDNLFILKTLDNILKFNKLKTYKYRYFLEYILKDTDIEIVNYIIQDDDKINSFNKLDLISKFTFLANKIKYKRIKNIFDQKEIKKNDILIAWYYFPSHMKMAASLNCYKIIMGQHFIKLNNYSNFSKYKINMFVSEINLSENDFVKRYFNLENVETIIMPYVYGNRFKKTSDIHDRLNKALAIGTLSTVRKGGYEEYIKYAKTPWIQPMRGKILANKEKLTKWVDSYISYIFENRTLKYNTDDLYITHMFKKIWNYYNGWRQSKYLSFDMVEKFNEYKMFICPEEYVGLPGIGFVEGMACGCAYIGLDHDMYKCMGLIPGVHYISYDGTIRDLVRKIEYYQMNTEELSIIADNGYHFVRKHFNEKTVAENFLNRLRKLGEEVNE